MKREKLQPAGEGVPLANPNQSGPQAVREREGHYGWPSEFPVMLCGVISPWATLRQAQEAAIGLPLCSECAKIAPLSPMSRRHPYRGV